MPRLLQINATANWGSTGRIAEQIGAAAMERGWESYIAYGRSHGRSDSILLKVGNKVEVLLHVAKARFFDGAGLGSYLATRRLIRKIRKIAPDVVHLHNIHGYYLNYKVLFDFLNSSDIKTVWTFHDFWAVTGHCTHFVEASCGRWRSSCHDCPLSRRYPTTYTDFSERNHKDKKSVFSSCGNLHLVAISDWAKDCISRSFLADKPVSIIPNGVDLDVFRSEGKPYDLAGTEGKFIILAVASQWKEGKGFEDFLELSRLLKDDEVIVLVGVNHQQKSVLPANIIGMDCVGSTEELAGIYSAADVLLSMSYAETFGMTIVEAAACGTPAVVYDNTGQRSLVSRQTGYAVPTGDVGAVYEAVQQIRINGKVHYSEACRARAERNFDKDKCFEKYIDLYESLLDKPAKNQ